MTTTPVIRVADKTDISAITILAHAVWPDTYSSILTEAQIKYMLGLFYSHLSLEKQMDEGHIFLMALMNAETVGFASYSHANYKGIYKVHKLYVHPMLHGKGFGKTMLDTIAQEIIDKDATAMQLNVNRHNRAVSFYERYGFKTIGEEDIAIGEGYFMNDYVMEKKL